MPPAIMNEALAVYDRWSRTQALREEGYTVSEIATRLGVTHQRVSQLLATDEPRKPARPPAGGPYPWREWFWNGTWTARRGSDFSCTTSHYCQQVRNMASRLGVGVKVRLLDPEGSRVRVTVVPKRAIGRPPVADGPHGRGSPDRGDADAPPDSSARRNPS